MSGVGGRLGSYCRGQGGDIRNIRKQKQERGSRSYEVEKIYKRRGLRNWLVAAKVVEEDAEL